MAKTPLKNLSNFPLGAIGVDVISDSSRDGGDAESRRAETGRATIWVGVNAEGGRVTEVLMHEAFELAASIRGLRFREDHSSPDDGSDHTIFVMTHQQMQDVFQDMGGLVFGALPRLIHESTKTPHGKPNVVKERK